MSGPSTTLEIITTRTFNVPRKRLFQAFSDPKQLAAWFGPNGFSNTFKTFEFRSGGEWIYTMHGPTGVDFPNHSRFLEIIPDERIHLEHLPPVPYLATFTLTDQGNKSALHWRAEFLSVEATNDKFKEFVTEANKQNLDRLEALLAGRMPT